MTIQSTTTTDLIIEAGRKGFKQVKVEFYPAYNHEKHSLFPEKLKDSLKIAKVEALNVIEDPRLILDLINSTDVNKITIL